MSELNPQLDPPETPAAVPVIPPVIAYQSVTAAQPRPGWIYALVGIYLLLVAVLLATPIWIAIDIDRDLGTIAAVAVTILTICGLGLILTPVRAIRRRPMTRRSILVPIIASGLLFGGIVFGGGLALAQVCAPETYENNTVDHTPTNLTLDMVIASAVAVWVAWSLILGLIAFKGDPTSVGEKLHRILVAGSVLELLIAVPSHIYVRRRGDCCGGILTGTGICIGVAVALVSFGPTVLLLYYRRCKQIGVPTRMTRND